MAVVRSQASDAGAIAAEEDRKGPAHTSDFTPQNCERINFQFFKPRGVAV